MIVSDIQEFDKKRCKVYIDGEFAFILYKGELRDYAIKIGCEIPNESYSEIMETLLPKRCKLRAMNLLQKKDYTEKQLRDKLKEGFYPAEIVDEAIDYVKSFRYLDDERFARDYIAYHMPMRSKNRISQDLTSKGIDKEIIVSVLDELYSEANSDVELEQVKKLLTKKHYVKDQADYKEKQKLMAFLLRKGFQISEIRKALDFDPNEDTF